MQFICVQVVEPGWDDGAVVPRAVREHGARAPHAQHLLHGGHVQAAAGYLLQSVYGSKESRRAGFEPACFRVTRPDTRIVQVKILPVEIIIARFILKSFIKTSVINNTCKKQGFNLTEFSKRAELTSI